MADETILGLIDMAKDLIAEYMGMESAEYDVMLAIEKHPYDLGEMRADLWRLIHQVRRYIRDRDENKIRHDNLVSGRLFREACG